MNTAHTTDWFYDKAENVSERVYWLHQTPATLFS